MHTLLGPCVCAQGVAVDKAVLRRPAGRDQRRRSPAPLQPRCQRVVKGPQLGVLVRVRVRVRVRLRVRLRVRTQLGVLAMVVRQVS